MEHRRGQKRKIFSALAAILFLVVACQGLDVQPPDEVSYGRREGLENQVDTGGGMLDGAGIPMIGGGAKSSRGSGSAGIGVNTFLWRATLDTVGFMPLSSADPFGGVIITDWYSPPETPMERFKMTVYILDRQLRADGVKVSVFRQAFAEGNRWVDSTISPGAATDLENAILTRARQLKTGATAQ